ncbi:MAG: ThuA domain-containing protein [Planctomycetales bacterium]|nr:ThuA domain-containing protein [Planctomycetales bacterium]
MSNCRHLLFLFAALLCATFASANDKIKVLIVDGQNNHNWKATTPVMVAAFERAGSFQVDVATSPPSGGDMSKFDPQFSKYDAVVSNYNGQMWSEKTQQALLDYVKGGGGFVVVHAANNSFGNWEEYNRMIGLGGWGGRNEKSGPYVYFKDGEWVRDESKGGGGSHGPQHEFQIVVRNSDHPVTQGMPLSWMHAKDELYDSLRGPAAEMKILATAFSAKSQRHEPMIFTIDYGKGRVFHTPMGHADYSMQCAGFQATLLRGTQWVATGKVTLEIPEDFPSSDTVSMRE